MNATGIDASRTEPRSSSGRFVATLRRYGLAVVSVGVGLTVALLLQHYQLKYGVMSVLLLACTIASWYGGPGPSALAVGLCLLGFNYLLLEPRFHLHVDLAEIPYLVILGSFALLISWFATTRRRLEEGLRQARDTLRVEVQERSSLLDLTHDSIFVQDMNATITYWNRGAEEFYGWTQKEAIGKRPHVLLHTVFPKPLEAIREELLRTDRWDGELTHTKANGAQVIVASRWSLRRDEQGRPVAILETGNDITSRKLREEEIRALNHELARRSTALESSNKEMEAFAYSISHDLRAPLRHMAGFAELLRRSAVGSLNEKGDRYVTMILEAANRMGSLIDDLLAFSRISRAEAHHSVVSLEQLVQEAVAEVRQDAKDRMIVWKIDPLPEWYGDRSMLRLALVNLIANAVKFTGTRSQAEIEVGCSEHKDDHIVLFVRDNGVGFDMKYSNKLFNVFQRLHPQEAFEGTGIGLATVQRIVSRHGGRIWAEGVVDGGATFHFSLFKAHGGERTT